MLNVKALLLKILGQISSLIASTKYETGTVSAYSGWSVSYTKYGKVVTIRCTSSRTSVTTWSTVGVCTLPSNLRPREEVFGIVADMGYNCQKHGDGTPTLCVSTNGYVGIGIRSVSSVEGMKATATYLTA